MALSGVKGFNLKPGCSLAAGERVEVYYNLQQGGFSIVALDRKNPDYGRVVAYSENVTMIDASFCINQKKLDRIRTINRKTVYATVKGTFLDGLQMDYEGHRKGYCNPYSTGKFIDWESKQEIKAARLVYFYDKFFSYQGVQA